MIGRTLKMCTFYFVHIEYILTYFTGVELRHFFHPKYEGGGLVCVICNSNSFIPLYSNFA